MQIKEEIVDIEPLLGFQSHLWHLHLCVLWFILGYLLLKKCLKPRDLWKVSDFLSVSNLSLALLLLLVMEIKLFKVFFEACRELVSVFIAKHKKFLKDVLSPKIVILPSSRLIRILIFIAEILNLVSNHAFYNLLVTLWDSFLLLHFLKSSSTGDYFFSYLPNKSRVLKYLESSLNRYPTKNTSKILFNFLYEIGLRGIFKFSEARETFLALFLG